MELALELEDDLFFADLSKQLSLLIMDDSDDHPDTTRRPSLALHQDFSHSMNPHGRSPFVYENACRRESKGTGVFIPRSLNLNPGRKLRNGKFAPYNGKSNRSEQLNFREFADMSFQPRKE